MYYAGTVNCSDKVTCDNTESAFTRVNPVDQLLIICLLYTSDAADE